MVYGRGWTGLRIIKRMIAAYEVLAGGLYVAAPDAIFTLGQQRVDSRRLVEGAYLIALAKAVLGETSEEWLHLRAHCQTLAAGLTILGMCEQRGDGWSRASHYRYTVRAAERLAAAANRAAEEVMGACA